ncbi:MAG: hypothetical protein FWG20_00735 [Candidatus Cloacimonetes bacterium]|nr:hypothetical protein [Candidatus Cloacimonadota bacterium]
MPLDINRLKNAIRSNLADNSQKSAEAALDKMALAIAEAVITEIIENAEVIGTSVSGGPVEGTII